MDEIAEDVALLVARPATEARSRPPRRSLSIVVPAYNEARRLPATLHRIHEYLARRDFDAELIVVDDGSRDETPALIRNLKSSLPLLRVCTHSRNHGKDAAVFTGILASSREAVLFSDADLSAPIEDLDRLWGPYDRGVDVVIGSRRHPGADIGTPQPAHRRLMGHVFRMMVGLLCIRGFHDTQCGFKLFRSAAIRSILPKVRTRGLAFDVEILMRARELGFRIAEVGVRWNDVPGSHVQALRHSSRMFLQLLRMRSF